MAEKKPTKKQKIMKLLAVSSVILSLVLSTIAMYNSSDLDELKSGTDGETSLSKTGALYGTNGCENGGFSIQTGIDLDGDGILANEEVSDIKNVCHGTQGPPGPMGNRGYQGMNGTNGSDGINGTDGKSGVSSFINSQIGQHGPCPDAAIIEMGNNSSSGIVESTIKICFQELESGLLTDIHPDSGNSFSTGCNGGLAHDSLFIFAAIKDGNCLLYKIEDGAVDLISNDADFAPGSILGFTVHENRIWFDGNDGTGVQIWSTDGDSLWKESNLTTEVQQGDKVMIIESELILQHVDGITIFGESETQISGTFSNLTSANGVLIYNTFSGLNINGTILNAEINSAAEYHDGYYWFIATSDSDGPQLHRANSISIEKMTSSLSTLAGQNLKPTIIGNNLVFDSGGLFSYNTSTHILTEMNTSILSVGSDDSWIIYQDRIWFQCGIPQFGFELCESDGLSAWLYSDFASGMDSSYPEHFARLGDEIIALFDHPSQGGQLVKITEGVEVLWDYHSGNYDAGVHGELWVGSDMVYFIGDDPTVGLEMFGWAHGELTDEWIVIH